MMNELMTNYHAAHNGILRVLGDMKGYFEWLRENDPDRYEKRAWWLVDIANYVKAAKSAYIALEEEAESAYLRGVQQGKGAAERMDFEQQLRDFLNTYRPYYRAGLYQDDATREGIRQYSLQQSMNDFPNLY